MASPAYFAFLMEHHAWAVQQILDAAGRVPGDELLRPSTNHGSLLDTLVHMADVDQSWGRVARTLHEPDIRFLDNAPASFVELREFWLQEVDDLVAFARQLSSEDVQAWVRPPWKTHDFATWQILTHLSNHFADHANEAGARLNELGAHAGELAYMYYVVLRQQEGTLLTSI